MTERERHEIRSWYVHEVGIIKKLNEQWIAEGMSLGDRAFRAWQIRHDLRKAARERMKDEAAVSRLRARDRQKYGHEDGPSFDQLVAGAIARGLTQSQTWALIIEKAQKTNEEMNELCGL